MRPEDYFAGHPFALSVFNRVHSLLLACGPVEVRTSKSQVAFWCRRGFAYLWMPGKYLSNSGVDVVLSIVLGHRLMSSRFKEIVHPAPAHWMHHLEVHTIEDIDDEAAQWLHEARERAGCD
jgi:hypothetical protein